MVEFIESSKAVERRPISDVEDTKEMSAAVTLAEQVIEKGQVLGQLRCLLESPASNSDSGNEGSHGVDAGRVNTLPEVLIPKAIP